MNSLIFANLIFQDLAPDFEPVEQGSRNIFADLGFPNPEEHLAKAVLAVQIIEIIRQRCLSQATVADIFGIDQPKVSALMRDQRTSVPTLCQFLGNGPQSCGNKKGLCGVSVIEKKPTLLSLCDFSERPADDHRLGIHMPAFLLFLFHRRFLLISESH